MPAPKITPESQQVAEQVNQKMAQNAALNFIATVRHGGVPTMMFAIEHLVAVAIGSIIEAGGAQAGLGLWSQLVERCDNRINAAVKAKTDAAKPKIVLNS